MSWMTLKPYYARVAAGGRFLIVLESRGDETRFYQAHEEATVSHAEAIIDQLAMIGVSQGQKIAPRISEA